MKVEIRTTINLDDKDLIKLIETCKEKHRLAELLERALVAYCYEANDSKEESASVPADTTDLGDVKNSLHSLSLQLASLAQAMKSNHLYTVEAIGRLSGEVGAISHVPVAISAPVAMPLTANVETVGTLPIEEEKTVEEEPVTSNPDDEFEDVVVETKEEKPEPKPEPKSEPKPEPKKAKVKESKPESKPEPKSEPESEPKPEPGETTLDDSEGDEDEMSPEVASMLAQFFGGGGG